MAGGPETGGSNFFSNKKGGQTFFTRLLGGQIFFACIDAARPSSARNEECYLPAHSELSEGLNLVFRWPFIVCSMLWNKKAKVHQNIWNGFQNDLIWSY